MCSTSLGLEVVPEVKYSSSGSSTRVTPSGVNWSDSAAASSKAFQPAGAPPTAMRPKLPGRFSNLSVWALPITTCLTWPRSTRSTRSSGVSSVVAGITTAPSLIAASMVSHSGTSLPSMIRMRSPRLTPCLRSQLATRFERADISAKDSFDSLPSSSMIHSAGLSLPCARASK